MTERIAIGLGLNLLVIVVLLLASVIRVIAANRIAHRTCLLEDDSRPGCRPIE